MEALSTKEERYIIGVKHGRVGANGGGTLIASKKER